MADQLDIFAAIEKADREFVRKHVHRSDPRTSRASAYLAGDLARQHCDRIEKALSSMMDGGTAHEIAEALGNLNNVQVARRMRDLERQGRVVDSGTTRSSPSGRPSIVWKVAAKVAKESA